MILKIAINGFGRIGRCLLRAYFANFEHYSKFFTINALNVSADLERLTYYIKYDSIYGHFAGKITVSDNNLYINNKKIALYNERDVIKLNWQNIDLIAECTGKFNKKDLAKHHLNEQVKHILVSAPVKDADFTSIFGVNHHEIDLQKHQIISNSSCTSNCLIPVLACLHENFDVQNAFMTTIHSYTNDQNVLDANHKDPRRSRACALSIIPTSTGASDSVRLILPELRGKIQGQALRVPTAAVSAVDLTCKVAKNTNANEVNAILENSAKDQYKNVIEICKEPLVSVDFIGNPHSAIMDHASTHVVGDLVRVLCWYDNEWGFAMRMLDNIVHLAKLKH